MHTRYAAASTKSKPKSAFTLMELLVVMAIIGILASLLLTSLAAGERNTRRKLCQTEEAQLLAAINQYYSTYSRLPASLDAVRAGTNTDFTFGTSLTGGGGELAKMPPIPGAPAGIITPNASYQNNNSELIAILRDDMFYPECATNSGQVLGHIYNTHQAQLYTGTLAAGPAVPGVGPGSPGVGADDILRDPWGMPYIVTLDLNSDGRVLDPSLNAMYQAQSPGANLYIPGPAVVWSFGPTRQINLTLPSHNPVNKYMVTSF